MSEETKKKIVKRIQRAPLGRASDHKDKFASPSSFPGEDLASSRKRNADSTPKPSGPSDDAVSRIRAAKTRLAQQYKSLDQSIGAEPSLVSPSPQARTDTTVSKATTAQYREKGRQLINRYKRENDIEMVSDDFDAKDFVVWLFSLKMELAASTWRLYRQSAYYVLMAKPDPDIEDALDMLDNDILETEVRKSSADATKRTSSLRQKRFPKKDLERYQAYLRYKSRSKLAQTLSDWLLAGIHTGLRPVEWRATSLESYYDETMKKTFVWLYVLNAKTTNNRGNGIIRTLDLSDLRPEVIHAIARMSERGLKWYEDGEYGTIQSQISQLLYKVGEEMFPRRKKFYSLYSCRHQFIANMKSLMRPEEVSALAGHNITDTARQNYGKARSAWSPGEIKQYGHARPIDDEVATVRKTISFYQTRKDNVDLAMTGVKPD